MEVELTNEQRGIQDYVFDWLGSNKQQYIAISGYAGTGKTTLIGDTARQMRSDLNIKFLTFTGKASVVLSNKLVDYGINDNDICSTLHSYLYRFLGKDNCGSLKFTRKFREELDGDVLIVDESSMLNSKLFSDILNLNRPIIFVGDPGQLPPINDEVFKPLLDTDLVLKHIHRQAWDNPIIRLATQTRKQQPIKPGNYDGAAAKVSKRSNKGIDLLAKFKENIGEVDSVILCAKNKTRVKLNSQVRQAKGYGGNHPLPGERLVCLKNNKEKELMNGQCVFVKSTKVLEEDLAYKLVVVPEGRTNEIECLAYAKTFNNSTPQKIGMEIRKDEKRLKEIQQTHFITGDPVLFDYGYALSVHKAQGSEWERVVLMDERMMSQTKGDYFRWLYTGITRAKEKLLILS